MPGILSSLYQRTWWSLLIRGITAILIGILAMVRPGEMLEFLVTLLGILVLVIGIVTAAGALRHRSESERWLLVLIPGLLGIAIGIVTIAWPAVTIVVVLYLIAIWALVHGISEIYNAVKLSKDIRGEWTPLLVGIVSVVFGIVLLVRPLTAGAAVTWLVGIFLLVLGMLWVIMAVRARRWL
jgi:uncharacterized membrane protein HdeD (DUF308 family)